MPQAPPLPPHRWTRQEYDRLVDLGALEDLPVELLDGVIVEVGSQGPSQRRMVEVLAGLLAPAAAVGDLRIGVPLAAGEWSEPAPALAIVARSTGGRPRASRLAIEVVVSQRSVARYKAGVYAAAGVPEYWIVDVPERAVTVHERPTGDGYERRHVIRGDEAVAVPEYGIASPVEALFARAGA